jgi:hypothetical protein
MINGSPARLLDWALQTFCCSRLSICISTRHKVCCEFSLYLRASSARDRRHEQVSLRPLHPPPPPQALAGDAADNIRGIRGIGPKTAAGLIQQYHTVGALLEHVQSGKDLPIKYRRCVLQHTCLPSNTIRPLHFRQTTRTPPPPYTTTHNHTLGL